MQPQTASVTVPSPLTSTSSEITPSSSTRVSTQPRKSALFTKVVAEGVRKEFKPKEPPIAATVPSPSMVPATVSHTDRPTAEHSKDPTAGRSVQDDEQPPQPIHGSAAVATTQAEASADAASEPPRHDATATDEGRAEISKQVLGERLYPLISAVEPTRAGKITGMLLTGLDDDELLHLLESSEALNAQIAEAIAVLQEHAAGENETGSGGDEAEEPIDADGSINNGDDSRGSPQVEAAIAALGAAVRAMHVDESGTSTFDEPAAIVPAQSQGSATVTAAEPPQLSPLRSGSPVAASTESAVSVATDQATSQNVLTEGRDADELPGDTAKVAGTGQSATKGEKTFEMLEQDFPPPPGGKAMNAQAPAASPAPAMSWASRASAARDIPPPVSQHHRALSSAQGHVTSSVVSIPPSPGHALAAAASVSQGSSTSTGTGAATGGASAGVHPGTGSRPLSYVRQPARGLKNLGNTCFLNAVLQNLVASEQLRAFMLSPQAPEEEGQMTAATRRWFGQMNATGSGPVVPAQILKAVSARHREFAGRSQQDSQEVLRHVLEGIRSEEVTRIQAQDQSVAETESKPAEADATSTGSSMPSSSAPAAMDATSVPAAPKRAPPGPDPPTVVDHIFGGNLRSTVVCLSCKALSCVYEPFLDLSLPIPTEAELKGSREAHKAGGTGTEWTPLPTSPEDCRHVAQHAVAAHLDGLRASNGVGISNSANPSGPSPPTTLNDCFLAFLAPELLQVVRCEL